MSEYQYYEFQALDLRDLDARGKGGGFQSLLQDLKQTYSRKRAFVDRLRKAGL